MDRIDTTDGILAALGKVPFSHPSLTDPAFLVGPAKGSPQSLEFKSDDLIPGDPIWELGELGPRGDIASTVLTYAGRFLQFDSRKKTARTFYEDETGTFIHLSIPLYRVVIVPACSSQARSTSSPLAKPLQALAQNISAITSDFPEFRSTAQAMQGVFVPRSRFLSSAEAENDSVIVDAASLLRIDAAIGGI